jgi:hypothetical protein
MKQHTGEGLGGALGLVVWLLVNPGAGGGGELPGSFPATRRPRSG